MNFVQQIKNFLYFVKRLKIVFTLIKKSEAEKAQQPLGSSRRVHGGWEGTRWTLTTEQTQSTHLLQRAARARLWAAGWCGVVAGRASSHTTTPRRHTYTYTPLHLLARHFIYTQPSMYILFTFFIRLYLESVETNTKMCTGIWTHDGIQGAPQ